MPALARVASWARAAGPLLPVRLVFGATFLYAGIDKLLDPRFLDPSDAASIAAILRGFERASPLAAIVRLAEPVALPVGLGIALLEIAVALAALTGRLVRPAALAGFGLSLLFLLTASWATRPFYYGADLPFAVGWLAIALAPPRRGAADAAGRSGAADAAGRSDAADATRRHTADAGAHSSERGVTRRALLEALTLGAATLVVAAATVRLRVVARSASPRDPPSSPRAADGARGVAVAAAADVAAARAVAFTIPFDAEPPLLPGDPGVVVLLPDGRFVAFDATCTHAGCAVEWSGKESLLRCPCHGASFDPAVGGRPVDGPAERPLTELPIRVDAASGWIVVGAFDAPSGPA